MRGLLVVAVLAVASGCSAAVPPRSGASVADLVIPTAVPNGKVEVIVKSTYAVGNTVRATIRLVPTTGSLRGPLDAVIQASGFHGTATVRHLSVDPISVKAGSADVAVAWDMRDDAGQAVGADDYSLVFTVVDDAGRSTTVGATVQVR